jgi:hypothetical protein
MHRQRPVKAGSPQLLTPAVEEDSRRDELRNEGCEFGYIPLPMLLAPWKRESMRRAVSLSRLTDRSRHIPGYRDHDHDNRFRSPHSNALG